MTPKRRMIIGVMGPATCGEELARTAEDVGRRVADAGHILLCGGRTGVMEAAARGARQAGGLTIGILPGHDARESPPNPHIEIPIYTGMSHARNLINVLSSQVVVAIGGAYGTLSEIALAHKCGKPVILLDSWSYVPPDGQLDGVQRVAYTAAEAVALISEVARVADDG